MQLRGCFRWWWQVKDSNLRSFRDGFTVRTSHAADLRKRLLPQKFRAYSGRADPALSTPADDIQRPPDSTTPDMS
jgi:hypothetical protein